MKIVEMIPNLNYRAGAETFFVNLCKELSLIKCNEVHVVVLYDGILKEYEDEFNNLNIHPVFLGKKHGFDNKCAKNLRKLLKEIKPDVVHTHICCLNTYFLAFGSKKQDWKLIHTCHNRAQFEATKTEKTVRKILLRKKAITNVAISDLIQKTVYEVYGPKYEVPVIYNGIPLKHKTSKEVKYDFICVANFSKWKNHEYLLRSFKKLLKEFAGAKLICLGDGMELENCKNLAQNLDIFENVTFTGSVSNTYDYLEQSKIFVLPSLTEGNPISILEAMDCGLPVIASNIGGVGDVIKNNINGILINPNIENDLCDAMLNVMKDEKLQLKFSDNNKSNIGKYSIEKCAFEYSNLFTRLVEERNE